MRVINFCKECSLKYPQGSNLEQTFNYVRQVSKILRKELGKGPIYIWCRGSSGSILAALLAKSLKRECYIRHVPKCGESVHNRAGFVTKKGECHIIIDDFMRSGSTLNSIWEAMSESNVKRVNFLVLANCWVGDEWNLNFIPETIIIDKDSIMPFWHKLKPGKYVK